MEIAHLSPVLAVTGQIRPEDLTEIAAAGFRAVVNNRPDGEEPGQPDSAAIAVAAERAGLRYAHVPVRGGEIGDDDVRTFARILSSGHTPVLAFCRTGNRSRTLWERSRGKHEADGAGGTAAGR